MAGGFAAAGRFHQAWEALPVKAFEMTQTRRGGVLAQDSGALMDKGFWKLGHSRGDRLGVRREGKDVRVGETAFFNYVAGSLKHGFCFGGESRDEVCGEGDVGSDGAEFFGESDDVLAVMSAAHSFEDDVVAGLDREMEMGLQARLFGDEAKEGGVYGGGV